MKDGVIAIAPLRAPPRSGRRAGLCASGSIATVRQTSAFDTTAFEARMVSPDLKRTPAARPSSTIISST